MPQRWFQFAGTHSVPPTVDPFSRGTSEKVAPPFLKELNFEDKNVVNVVKFKAPQKKYSSAAAVIRRQWDKRQLFLNEPTIGEKKNSSPGFPGFQLQATVNLRIARHETCQWLADKGETASSSRVDLIQSQILAPIKVIFKGVRHLQDVIFVHQKKYHQSQLCYTVTVISYITGPFVNG